MDASVIKEAVAKLDKDNSAQWEKPGIPKVGVLKAVLSEMGVDAEEVKKLSRQSIAEVLKPSEETEESAAEEEPVSEYQEALNTLAELEDKILEATRAKTKAQDDIEQLQKEVAAAAKKVQDTRPAHTEAEKIQAYQQAAHKQRIAQAMRRQAAFDQFGKQSLDPRSPIDQKMALPRKTDQRNHGKQ